MIRTDFQHASTIHRTRIPPVSSFHYRLHRLEKVAPWDEDVSSYVGSVNHYPDYAAFTKRVAAHFGVDERRLVLGQGIEGLIRDLLMLTIVPEQSAFAFTWPTCAMFDVYAKVFKAKPQRIVTHPDRPPTVDQIADALTPATRILVLPNPGQPVDVAYHWDDLLRLLRRCQANRTLLVIDEAYYGFGGPTCLQQAQRHSGIVVLRTFSKMYGGASLRIGFATGDPETIAALNGVRQSGELAGPSMRIAEYLMDHYEGLVLPAARETVAGRDWLADRVEDMGFKTRAKHANHVLIEFQDAGAAANVVKFLAGKGVHIRGGYQPPLERHVLVTAGPRDVMRYVYDCLVELVDDRSCFQKYTERA